MKQINDVIYADEGKLLQTPVGLMSEVNLGETKIIVDGKVNTVVLDKKDIVEVIPVTFEDSIYYAKAKNYAELVSELIRLKYSLDYELALCANLRLDPNLKVEEEFLNWRNYCKYKAKLIYNE